MPKPNYKYCFVPLCTSTSVATPNKLFFSVPKDVRRKKWTRAANRAEQVAQTATHYCCEDHFNLEDDAENLMEHKLTNARIRLKFDVVPHIFNCQPKRATSHTNPKRSAFLKRQSYTALNDALFLSKENHIPASESNEDINTEDQEISGTDENISKCDKSTQCRPPHRSKSTQTSSKGSTVDAACSPIKTSAREGKHDDDRHDVAKMNLSSSEEYDEEVSSELAETDFENYTSTDSEPNVYSEFEDELLKNSSIRRTLIIIEKEPRIYIGIPKDCMFIVDLLVKRIMGRKCKENIYLTLKKLRLNESFTILGHDFGMSACNASRVFEKFLPLIALYCKQLIVWPSKTSIRSNMPVPFRARYSNVEAIIDCLEIEIEKPTDPVKQALTWSEYKKCNTLKYLVSCTPDGIVNFVSTGFGGRTSDVVIVENCKFLDCLKSGMHIMADRGFKHLDKVLADKGCTLVRPPSVSATAQSSKEDVIETKVIASLRIHIERVVRRFREFSFLKPHASININLIPKADDAMFVAGGLINAQGALIK